MIEAKKLAYADMLRYVGDPRFATVPVADMLSASHAAARARLIDPARARCEVESTQFASITQRAGEGSETVYLAVVDREGMIVSLIQSIFSPFGSGLVAPGTGFALQNRGALFTLAPGKPNTIAPRKRPLHTLIPGFMEKDGVRIGFGIIGGWNQAQAHAQFVSGIADFDLSIQDVPGGGPVREADIPRVRRPDRDPGAGTDACGARSDGPSGDRGRSSQRHGIRVRPGGDERRRRDSLRRLGSAA